MMRINVLRTVRARYVAAAVAVLCVAGALTWTMSRGAADSGAGPSLSSTLTPTGAATTATPSATPLATPSAAPSAAPSASPDAAAGTPSTVVAPPAPANDAAASAPRPSAAPVHVGVPATVGTEAVIRVTSLEAVAGTGQGAGEVAGPGVRVNLVIDNRTGQDLSLAGTVVNFSFGTDDTPAIGLSGPGVAAFPAVVRPGAQATAAYVFNVPVDQRDAVRIAVDYRLGVPVVVFEGSAPKS